MRFNLLRLIAAGAMSLGASVSVAAPGAQRSGAIAHPAPTARVAPAITTPSSPGVTGAPSAAGSAPANNKSLNSLTGTEHCTVGQSPVPKC